jgi:hypothetical protein
MKSDVIDNRLNLSNHKNTIPASKMMRGSINDKFPVVMDDGKTVIFISDRAQEAEIRYRYNMRRK